MPMTIDSMIRWWGKEQPDLLALCHEAETLHYGALNDWVSRVAAHYVDLGLQVGDRVCISGENSISWVVSALATLRAGGVIAGLNPKLVQAEFSYLLGDYAPRLLVCDPNVEEKLAALTHLEDRFGKKVATPQRLTMPDIYALRDAPARDVVREVDPNALALIVTTSGSTARPKGVMFSNHTLIDHVSAFRFEEPLNEAHPRMLIVAPFNTTAGGMVVLHSLIQCGTAYFQARFDPEQALEILEKKKIHQFCAAPIFFQRIADLPAFEKADVSSIKISITGGAAVPIDLLRRWADKGVLVRQMYGQSEAGGWGVNNPRRYALSHPERCGYAGVTRDIAVIDADGRRLGPNEEGQIIMRGPGQMLGYWNDPEATAKTVVDGWLHTGDIGVLDENGLLKFVDRMKDIIISGGLNISAAEVERTILELKAVEEVAVIAAPDAKFGETPMAIVYLRDTVSAQDIVEYCNTNLSSYKVPRYVVFSPEPLPRLATGKISKPALRAQYAKADNLPERVR